MYKITIDTVRRANRKTIMQVGNQKAYSGNATSGSSFDVSISVMGKVYGQRITANQIKSSFSKAIENHA